MDFDTIYESIGDFGLYQFILYILRQWICLAMTANTFLFFAFNSVKPKIACNEANFNSTNECDIRADCGNISFSIDFNTCAEHFGLVCEKAWQDPLIPTLTTCATLSVIASGYIADRFGRKPLLVAAFAVYVAAGFIAGLAPNWELLTTMLIVGGACYGLLLPTVNTLYAEEVTKRYRSVIATAAQWTSAYIVNALIAYVAGDWRWYILAANILLLPLVFLHGFFVVESPRWLVQRGEIERAIKSLDWIARVNGVTPDPPITAQMLETFRGASPMRTKRDSMMDLVRQKKLAIFLVLQMMHSTINYMAVNVIMWNVSALVGNPMLQVAVSGFLRIWVPFFVVFLDWKAQNFGRRPTILGTSFLINCCFVALTIIFSLGKQENLKIGTTILGHTGAILTFSIFWITHDLYNVELFPTVLRASASSSAEAVGLVAAVLTPYLLYFGEHYWSALPYLAVSFLLTSSFILDLIYLPETHGKPLTECLEKTSLTSRLSAQYGESKSNLFADTRRRVSVSVGPHSGRKVSAFVPSNGVKNMELERRVSFYL